MPCSVGGTVSSQGTQPYSPRHVSQPRFTASIQSCLTQSLRENGLGPEEAAVLRGGGARTRGAAALTEQRWTFTKLGMWMSKHRGEIHRCVQGHTCESFCLERDHSHDKDLAGHARAARGEHHSCALQTAFL